VRGGEVKRTFSRGSRTKDWGPSSMTQFIDMVSGFSVSRWFVGCGC